MSARPAQRYSLSSGHHGVGAASATDRLLVPFLGALLLLRVLTDHLSSPDSRHSGSLNLSAVIAVLFLLVAGGLLLRRRHGMLATVLVVLWICVWTAIAVNTGGASTETLREGVRELSVVAVVVIVYNARGIITVPIATRVVQLVGFIPAVIALYQLTAHTGMDVGGHLRSNGTFAHPNSAVMFFTIAATASLWRYLDYGRHRSDAFLVALFGAAVISTFSIDGLVAMFAAMVAFGTLHPGPIRVKLVPYAVGGLVVLVFFATPLGAQRVASETATSLAAAERGEGSSSLTWRLKKWKTLIPEWEQSPVFGRGLGTTTTAEGTLANPFAGYPPHSEYVRYLVETGVIGVMILLTALTILVRSLLRRRKMGGTLDAGTLNVAILAIAVLVGCLINSLADNTLLNSPTDYAAALIVAAVLALPGIKAPRAPVPQTT
jgi:O-antigen ligase